MNPVKYKRAMQQHMDEESKIRLWVKQLPKPNLFHSFLFDERSVWVGLRTNALKRILHFAKVDDVMMGECEDEKIDTLWQFLNEVARIDGSKLWTARVSKHRCKYIEFCFDIEKLPDFVILVNDLVQRSPDVSPRMRR
eukprot:TRINITY_DN10313_c0_g1_i1.p1 TRINITY_DN10313_c0_g1~~TRINITY_DN10313_c0_g1_i1.p1  ORF type:complete len:138 (-),score=18.59 TRINITY_DN10313_c0_g1_i1:187-600(-)